MAVAITVECHWIFRTRGKFSLNYQNPAVARRKWQIWRMFTPTAKESILRAARKSDEMLEPYEWKRSRTVLRRERAGNRPDLADYKWLVRLLKGQVVEIALNSKVHINPMEINLFARNDKDKDYDPIAAKCSFIVSICELILGNKSVFGKKEVAVIDEACKKVYYRFAENPLPENMPVLEDLYNELQNGFEGEKKMIGCDLAIALSRYVTGSLSYFNHRSNVDINERLVCFDLKNMDSNQRDLTMLIIQESIWDRVAQNRERDIYTWVDIDEFHLLLREPLTARYSVEIWKRFRKWGGVPTGITQNIKDLFRSPEIQNILDTTNFIAMLNQSGDDARLLAEHLDLSEEEEGYIKSGEPGKGLLWVEGIKIPFEDDFPKNTICYKVMTTKPGESIKEKRKIS